MGLWYCIGGGIFAITVTIFGILYYLQKKRSQELEKIVFVDRITGGSTYEKFKLDLEDYLKKNNKQICAILSIDIDKSKYI